MHKNRFPTFLFSIIPGCGLMYLGYMKKGLQVMLMFAATCFIGSFFSNYSIGWFGALFFLLLPIIWFYQMFDAMHTVARMKNQGIELPADDGFYLLDNILRFSPTQNWTRTTAKIIAGILISVGSFSLVLGTLNTLLRYSLFDEKTQKILHLINNAIRHDLIPAIVSIVLIIAGIRLLRGMGTKKTDNFSDMKGDLS